MHVAAYIKIGPTANPLSPHPSPNNTDPHQTLLVYNGISSHSGLAF